MKLRARLLVLVGLAVVVRAQAPAPPTNFRVKYLAEGVVYIGGGRNAGLAEGMKLTVKRESNKAGEESVTPVAELLISSVAESSAVCEIKTPNADIHVGDVAELSVEGEQAIQLARAVTGSKQYAQVVTFTEEDPLEEEARESVPRPPLPEVNRIRGRIGFEYSGLQDRGDANLHSSQTGIILRTDMTRIGGSYWGLSGYWRGRVNTRSGSGQQTLNDLLNRTYHITLSYNSPKSPWVAGFGRFYLPWAASLNTIDGGYAGRRLGEGTTAGIFAGSTPDPTSWNYSPGRQMFGSFVSHEGGSFDDVRYITTAGVAATRLYRQPERQFLFLENSLFYKQYFSVYHNLEADASSRTNQPGQHNSGVSRSFLTLRFQPYKILSLDLSHNYFKDVPSFDRRLIGTGLLDKLLFQGLSAGFRLELPYRTAVYSSLGRSNKSGDSRNSWNQMYGFLMNNIAHTGLRADARFSRFDSSFGRGDYKSVSLSRTFGEALRLEGQAGQQNYGSPFAQQNRARFLNGSVEWNLGPRYFLGTGLTYYKGTTQNYTQWFVNLGCRF